MFIFAELFTISVNFCDSLGSGNSMILSFSLTIINFLGFMGVALLTNFAWTDKPETFKPLACKNSWNFVYHNWFPHKCRNSILMMCHYPDLCSASDLLKQIFHAAQPIRSITQFWIVMCYQCGILCSFLGRHFARNVGCFLRLLNHW